MKNTLIYLLAAAALAGSGCAEKETVPIGSGYGRIVLAGAADASIETRTVTAPAIDDFSFTLTGEGYEGSWQRVADFAQCDTIFREGPYTARIAHGDPDAEGADKAFYAGEKTFDLQARRTNTVSVTARIANSQTEIRATKQFLCYFHDAKFTVTTGSGNVFTFTPGVEPADEAVFVQAGTTLTVTGTARRQSPTGGEDGPEVEFTVAPLTAAKPRTCHIFTFDAADAGSATVKIVLGDDQTTVEPVTVELNDQAIKDDNK